MNASRPRYRSESGPRPQAVAHLGSLCVALALGACAAKTTDPDSGVTGGESGQGGESGAMPTGGVSGQAGGGAGGPIGGVGGTGIVAMTPEGEPDSEQCKHLARKNYQACLVDRWGDGDAGTEDEHRLRRADLIGTVEAIEPSVQCEGIGSANTLTAQGYGVRIVAGDEGLTLGLALPWQDPLFAAGDEINVSYHRDPEVGWSEGPLAPAGSIVVRDAEGELLFWLAETHYMLKFLGTPPELVIANGEPACWFESTGCPEAIVRGSLRVDAGGQSVEVPFGEMRNVGDYIVVVADNEEHVYTGTVCRQGHSVVVLAVRRSLEALNAQP